MKMKYFGLNEGEQEQVITREIEKAFDYEEDIEEFGKKEDIQNRKIFSKEETDSIFIAETDVLEDINALRYNDNIQFDKHIEEIKEQASKEEKLFKSEEFDIFGGITDDKTKINDLGNVKHREIKKNKFKILGINKNTDNEQYRETLKEITNYLDSAIDKSKFGANINAYFASCGVLNNQRYNILYINPQNALDTLKENDKINLYSIKLKEDVKGVALTNIIYYDNNNKTLPLRNDSIR